MPQLPMTCHGDGEQHPHPHVPVKITKTETKKQAPLTDKARQISNEVKITKQRDSNGKSDFYRMKNSRCEPKHL